MSTSLNEEDKSDLESLPVPFQELYRKFFKINTHLTFLSSHSRSSIPTFDLVKTISKDITKLVLAIIVRLLPVGDVVYEYVDENQLELSMAQSVQFNWEKGYESHQPQSVDDAYKQIASKHKRKCGISKQLLIFDFRDTKIDGIDAFIKSKRRRLEESEPDQTSTFFLTSRDLSMKKLSHTQLLNMIQGRNSKFLRSIMSYLSNFSADERLSDMPMKLLSGECESKIPTPPVFLDPLGDNETSKSIEWSTSLPSLDTMVDTLEKAPFYKGQIAKSLLLNEERKAQYAKNESVSNLIHPDLKYALEKHKGISIDSQLYSHQSEALQAVMNENKHVVVTTSTNSGKSLIYQIPIINDILWEIEVGVRKRSSTAIFIFATKALAQDQKRSINALLSKIPSSNERRILVETYDGDTSFVDRKNAQSYADIIFTNPDTIHASILPNHDKSYGDEYLWHDFLSNLRYIVVDELHVYKGSFGIHVSCVMSRLSRIISYVNPYGPKCQFISCSATIQNAINHFTTVCAIRDEDEAVHISNDGSSCSERRFLAWRPPTLMNKKGKSQSVLTSANSSELVNNKFMPRESPITESAKILVHLISTLPNIKVIVFCTIRKVCELLIKEVKSIIKSGKLSNRTGLTEEQVMSYRGGYSRSDRRKIEERMFKGELRAIVATNALELGIDLSDLDVVISCGFPISKSNLHQQFGRAGRRKDSQGSLAILVGGANPIDQHYMKNAEELVNKTYEDLCVDGLMSLGTNSIILEMHLQCAASEWPIDLLDDIDWFVHTDSSSEQNRFVQLCVEKLLKNTDGKYLTSPKYLPSPWSHVAIRAIEEESFAVVDVTNEKNEVMEEIESSRVCFSLYDGAIFLHQGLTYLTKDFNAEKKYAKVERVNVDWTTQQRDFTDVDPIEIERIKQLRSPATGEVFDIPVYYGKIETTMVVFGYFKVNRRGEILEAVDVKNPPVRFTSKGLWIDIPNSTIDLVNQKQLSPAGGIHAAQHAIMNIFPLFISGGATTNPNARYTSSVGEAELMTECKAPKKEFAQRQSSRKRPARIIFHDSKGGTNGSGISAKTFEYIDEILETTYNRISECECEWGCPECVTGSFCKEMSLVMSKPAAGIIIGSLLGYDPVDLDKNFRNGPEENMPQINVETVESSSGTVKFSKDIEVIR